METDAFEMSRLWRHSGESRNPDVVLTTLNQLRESPDYELSLLSERKPGMVDELVTERAKILEKETTELETQAAKLAQEIAELTGEEPSRIM